MRRGVFILAVSLLFSALIVGRAWAQDGGDAHDRVAAGQAQPLDQILPEIRRSHPGTFYDAQGPFAGADGQMHYRLKWMTPEGRIVWFDADARTGRVLGEGGGRYDYQSSTGAAERLPQDNKTERRHFGDDGRSDPDRFGDGGFGGARYDRDAGEPMERQFERRDRDWDRGQRGHWDRGRDVDRGEGRSRGH